MMNQIIGIQLASRRDVWTLRAEARGLEPEAKASLAQEASVEESLATNRVRTSSTTVVFLVRGTLRRDDPNGHLIGLQRAAPRSAFVTHHERRY